MAFDPLILLASAQCIFMSLPIIGLLVLSRHRPKEQRVNPVRLLKEFAAISAFILLVIFFSIESQLTLIILASMNLALRIMEVLLYIHLVHSAPPRQRNDKEDSVLQPALLDNQGGSLYQG
jgi:amino acid transporter